MNRWHSLPAEVYALVEETPATVLLECAKPCAAQPWTRLFTAPARIVAAHAPAEIPRLFTEIESAVASGHFAAGYFSYECGACFEPKAPPRPSPAGEPLAWFGIYTHSFLFDHQSGAFVDGNPPALEHFSAARRKQEAAIEAPPEALFALTESEYEERIAAIHEWIRAGEVYQLNFTAPMRVRAAGSPARLYAHLRHRQPVEFGAFLHTQPDHRILSFSPELFFRMEDHGGGRSITTRPMKGTAPRGRTGREDRARTEWLRTDAKNCSENVMIVDLLRNDLGRLCNFGSVRVENLFAVERLPTLWQMTSTVRGELRADVGFQAIFRALFPCGSVTGAPKVRAMQLLAKIEDEPRGVYTGAIGYFSRERTVFSVPIRTLELASFGNCDGQRQVQRGRMNVGSGIVADSDAAEEFRECLLKAEFLTRSAHLAPDQFSLVESLLWSNGYPLIELHLDRLRDSANYFDFACDGAEIKAALLAWAAEFSGRQPRKVRLLLDRQGAVRIESQLLPELADAQSASVCIAVQRTDARDPMLFHKTTHRPLYAEAFQAATEAGFADVLFLNAAGEVTEGAISNVLIEKDGRWSTPPVECGLLAGVLRRHLLETRPDIEERVLHLEDLRQADAVYLANAVRGLRRVVIAAYPTDGSPASAMAISSSGYS